MISTIIELLMVVSIIIGFIYEEKLIEFEDKIAEKFKKIRSNKK